MDFVSLYGEKKWSYSTYGNNEALIHNYINPHIGDLAVQSITPREADKFIKVLQKTQPVEVNGRPRKSQYLNPPTIERSF